MKKKGNYLLFYLFILTSLLPLQAIPSFYIPDQIVESGVFINTDVKVSDFTDIVGIQFSIEWDSTVLRFNGLQDFALDIEEDENFGTTNTSIGALGFYWFDQSTTGVTLDDSTTLFSIQFEVIGSSNDSTLIGFGNFPTTIEVLGASLDTIPADFFHGKILVDPISSLEFEQLNEIINIKNNIPNPFSESTSIFFTLEQPIEIQILLYNHHGQLSYSEQRIFGTGVHELLLGNHLFPASGTYYLKMKSSKFLVTQKLSFF